MNVRETINFLSKFDPELPVMLNKTNEGSEFFKFKEVSDVLEVETDNNEKFILIETEEIELNNN